MLEGRYLWKCCQTRRFRADQQRSHFKVSRGVREEYWGYRCESSCRILTTAFICRAAVKRTFCNCGPLAGLDELVKHKSSKHTAKGLEDYSRGSEFLSNLFQISM